jgi:hypothetical protein
MSKVASLRALAAQISSKLTESGIRAVLCGGSCVTIYARGRYATRDFDFVLRSNYPDSDVAAALAELGYRPDSSVSGAFTHPDEEMIVDIRPAPPSLGDEPIGEPAVLAAGRYKLMLLSPTDCVKDRLAHFYFYRDRQGCEQAILVCLAQLVNMREVGRWSRVEGQGAGFAEFRRELCRRRRDVREQR